jgi:hypothetical protein
VCLFVRTNSSGSFFAELFCKKATSRFAHKVATQPVVPAGTSAFFFLRTFSFCAFGFKKKKWAYGLGGFTTAVL